MLRFQSQKVGTLLIHPLNWWRFVFILQVYDKVAAGDGFQEKVEVQLPAKLAEYQETIEQKTAEVDAKQAEKAEQVRRLNASVPCCLCSEARTHLLFAQPCLLRCASS